MTLEEHLLWDIRDLVHQSAYYSAVSAAGGFSKQSAARKMQREAPKPIPKPGGKRPEEKKFTSTKDLMALFNQRKRLLQGKGGGRG